MVKQAGGWNLLPGMLLAAAVAALPMGCSNAEAGGGG